MKIHQLNNPAFHATYGKLASAELPAAGLWKFKRFAKWFQEQMQFIEDTRIDLCKRHCKKNDDGEPIKEENQFVFDDGKKEEFEKEFTEFVKQDIEIKIKFHMHEIEAAKLTGLDMLNLDELLHDPEEQNE